MKLKDLERDISLVEKSINQMECINQDVVRMENQVEHVRDDMLKELHNLERNASLSLQEDMAPN